MAASETISSLALHDHDPQLLLGRLLLTRSREINRTQRCRVVVSYEACGKNEISLDIGEMIIILEETTGSCGGLWKGRKVISGREGWFPGNFVEKI